ncbi:MAG: hypothetical protein R2698_13805 [Microthrixaceae bacterium]
MSTDAAPPRALRRAPRRSGRLALLVLVAVLSAGVGCSTDHADRADTTPPTTTIAASAGHDTDGELADCGHFMPGELLTPEQAVVGFSADKVCPAYITVTTKVPTGFHNSGAVSASVTILDEAGAEQATMTVRPGETRRWQTGKAAIYRFSLSVIPTFTGTIEVHEP